MGRCVRCGACCGAYTDPCEELTKKGEKYFCKVYKNRLGWHKTISGREIKCKLRFEIRPFAYDYLCGYLKKDK